MLQGLTIVVIRSRGLMAFSLKRPLPLQAAWLLATSTTPKGISSISPNHSTTCPWAIVRPSINSKLSLIHLGTIPAIPMTPLVMSLKSPMLTGRVKATPVMHREMLHSRSIVKAMPPTTLTILKAYCWVPPLRLTVPRLVIPTISLATWPRRQMRVGRSLWVTI